MEGGFFFHPDDEDLSLGTPAFHPDDEDLSSGTPAEKATQPHGFCKQQNRNRCSRDGKKVKIWKRVAARRSRPVFLQIIRTQLGSHPRGLRSQHRALDHAQLLDGGLAALVAA